jgi:3-oxoacyl-[acyl-carrier protein] reductase
MKLSGKVALITGAGRGIGLAIAEKFAAEGAKVALVARHSDQLNSAMKKISNAGGKSCAIPADITDESQVIRMIQNTESELGQIDILVNNAGTMTLRPIVDTSVEEWNKIMDTNLLGVFLCSKYVLPSMMERKTGRIINIGSMAGRRGYPAQGAYCCSKHGLYGFSKVLAIECQQYGIKVNMVSPGGVLTELSKSLLKSRGESQSSEWMTADEVANGVLYIATQEGAAMTDELVLRRGMSEPWR